MAGKDHGPGHLLHYVHRKRVVRDELPRSHPPCTLLPTATDGGQATALVPSSFTSTTALWNTSSKRTSQTLLSTKPDRSASSLNAARNPKLSRTFFMLQKKDSFELG